MNRIIQIQKQIKEYKNLKEVIKLVWFWTVPDVSLIKYQNRKGKVRSLGRR